MNFFEEEERFSFLFFSFLFFSFLFFFLSQNTTPRSGTYYYYYYYPHTLRPTLLCRGKRAKKKKDDDEEEEERVFTMSAFVGEEEKKQDDAGAVKADDDGGTKVFGSGSKVFGAGFNPAAFASTTTTTTGKKEEGGGENNNEGDEEDVERECTKEFTPVVKLEIIEDSEAKTTGEENEEILFEAKTKAYRFLDGEWKERGLGPMKILEHKETKKCRLLMRRDKTLKICANFYIDPETKVTTHAGSEKARVFTTVDCSDGDEAPALQNMCIKFGSEEKAQLFQDKFEEAQKKMAALPKTEEEGEKEEKEKEAKEKADDLADDLAELAAKGGED